MQSIWEEHYRKHQYFRLEPHEYLAGFSSKCKERGITKVLDLGCGAGQDLAFLGEQGFKVEGVEFSPAAAANAEDLLQSKNIEGKVWVDNLFDKITNFGPEEFPAVIAVNSLEYTDQQTFAASFAELGRILEHSGLLYLVVSSVESEVELEVQEQQFFTQDELTPIVSKRFSILDFVEDSRKNLVYTLEKY